MVDGLFVDYNIAFDAVPSSMDKLPCCEMNRSMLYCVLNAKLNGLLQWKGYIWLAAASLAEFPSAQFLGQFCSAFFISDWEAGVKHIHSEFADDTELEGAADSLER